MREFDDFEKDAICKLKSCKERGGNVTYLLLLDGLFKDRWIEIRKSTKEVRIYFDAKRIAYYDNSMNAWIPKRELMPEADRTTDVMIKMIFLLEYLEKNGLVFMYDFTHTDNDIESFPTLEVSSQPIQQQITEKKVADLLISFFHKEVVVSQSIITLVANNFLTPEEIQHKETIDYANKSLLTGERSIIVANRAIVVSVALGIISVLLSLYSIVLNIRQMDQLEKNIEHIDQRKSMLKIMPDSMVVKPVTDGEAAKLLW